MLKTIYGEEYFLVNGLPCIILDDKVEPVQISDEGRLEPSRFYTSKEINLGGLQKYEGETKKLSQNPMKEFDDELRKLKDFLIHEEIYRK